MPNELQKDIYNSLKGTWWGISIIVIVVIVVAAFAFWNSLPESTKEKAIDKVASTSPPVVVPPPKNASDCSIQVDKLEFEQGQPYLKGMSDIRIGVLLPEVIQTLEGCGATYRIERDSPLIQRVEVTPKGGLVSGITYYTMRNEMNTIGFFLSSASSHQELRAVARRSFGPPDSQHTHAGLHYDQWNNINGMQLSIFENGGSFFRSQ